MFQIGSGRFGPQPGRLQPDCSIYSLNLDTLDALKMCNFAPVIWMTKSQQTGWHCTYLTSAHWHGNPAAFNRRCRFPTTQKQRGFLLASPGASLWQPGAEAPWTAERGLQETLEAVPQGCVILLPFRHPHLDTMSIFMFNLSLKRDWNEFPVEKWNDETKKRRRGSNTHVRRRREEERRRSHGLPDDSDLEFIPKSTQTQQADRASQNCVFASNFLFY